MITYLSGIVLIISAYYIGQYRGFVKGKSFFRHSHETPRVRINKQTKEFKTCWRSWNKGFTAGHKMGRIEWE